MNQDEYNRNSLNAVLSRMETKLDKALDEQAEQAHAIRKLWAALGRLDVRVAVIATSVSATFLGVKLLLSFLKL